VKPTQRGIRRASQNTSLFVVKIGVRIFMIFALPAMTAPGRLRTFATVVSALA
jgi:hypothetical protein